MNRTLKENYPLYLYGEKPNNIFLKHKIKEQIYREYEKSTYKIGNNGFNKALKVFLESVRV